MLQKESGFVSHANCAPRLLPGARCSEGSSVWGLSRGQRGQHHHRCWRWEEKVSEPLMHTRCSLVTEHTNSKINPRAGHCMIPDELLVGSVIP